MTGKELALILGGATLLGGTAGAAAVLVAGDTPPAARPRATVPSGMETRMERFERELAAITGERDELRASLASMRDRVAAAEEEARRGASRSSQSRSLPAGGGLSFGHHDEDSMRLVPGVITTGLGAKVSDEMQEVLEKSLQAAIERMSQRSGGDEEWTRLEPRDTDALNERFSSVRDRLAGLGNSFELRGLSEEERWTRAREALGLDSYQENELKAAVAERDRLMKDAMVVEKSESDGNGGSFEVRRLDPDRAREAQKAYDDRVGNTLTKEQAADWRRKGYAGAFGSSPFSGGATTTVMTIQSTHSSSSGSDGSDGSDGDDAK